MVKSVNLPCIFDTFCVLIPGVSKLVRILGCTANLAYCVLWKKIPCAHNPRVVRTRGCAEGCAEGCARRVVLRVVLRVVCRVVRPGLCAGVVRRGLCAGLCARTRLHNLHKGCAYFFSLDFVP